MKNLTKVLSVIVFGLSVGVAHASESGSDGGNGQDNVQNTRSYQENVAQKADTDKGTNKDGVWEESSWNGFQKADEAD